MSERTRQKGQGEWCVALVGMNATGKSRFGKTLASKLKLKRIDSDQQFTKTHGDIFQYIQKNGIDAFRSKEAELIAEFLLPGHLVILSGGAIESEKVRQALSENAAVIWIKTEGKRVLKNIRAAKRERHEFAEDSSEEKIFELLEKRNPLYTEVADIIIHGHIGYRDYLPVAIAELRRFYADGKN